MRCTGLSVIKGTEISSFNVEVIDVPDSGHFIAEERPDLVASTIRELLAKEA